MNLSPNSVAIAGAWEMTAPNRVPDYVWIWQRIWLIEWPRHPAENPLLQSKGKPVSSGIKPSIPKNIRDIISVPPFRKFAGIVARSHYLRERANHRLWMECNPDFSVPPSRSIRVNFGKDEHVGRHQSTLKRNPSMSGPLDAIGKLFGGGQAASNPILMVPPSTPAPPPPTSAPVGSASTYKPSTNPSFVSSAAPAAATGQTGTKSLLGQ